jgi:ubiquinone/menaquinone biosynthesis C-methylase UbiE
MANSVVRPPRPTAGGPLPRSSDMPARATMSERVYERLKSLLAPGLRNSQYEYADALVAAAATSRAWLDLGCGHNVVPEWIPLGGTRLAPTAGIDLDVEALRLNHHVRWRAVASGEALPFRDGSFDLVTANMVVEHVAQPPVLFREVRRVLAVGGRFLIHTPNTRGYTTLLARLLPQSMLVPLAVALHGRQPEDIYPTHYRANSAASLRELADSCGFSVASLEYVQSSPQFVRVPPLLAPEMLLISALSWNALAPGRPCLLAALDARALPGDHPSR